MRTQAPSHANPRTIPASLKRVRGTFRHGQCVERTGLLGTFLDSDGIEHVRHGGFVDGACYVQVSRNTWQTWAGTLTPAQFEALRSYLSVPFLPLGVRIMYNVNDAATWTNTEHPFAKDTLRQVFKSPYEQESAHNGKRFVWIGLSDRKAFDMDECGAYYRIRFEDGTEFDADPIEIYEHVGTVGGKPW